MKKTYIKTSHEEKYSDNSRILGILTNHDQDGKKIDSFPYIFRNDVENFGGTYIFFETIVDMMDYLLYGSAKTKRAYLKEDIFDGYYDNGIDGKFNEILKWGH
jgi:hypothetical protein